MLKFQHKSNETIQSFLNFEANLTFLSETVHTYIQASAKCTSYVLLERLKISRFQNIMKINLTKIPLHGTVFKYLQ